MDLRVVKTKNVITQAFLKLRNKLAPDKIKVKDICDEAQINKTTFYKHYADSFALLDEIENRAVEKISEDFENRVKHFIDVEACVYELFVILGEHSEHLRLVFRGRADVLSAKLERRLAGVISRGNEKISMKLEFITGGVMRVVKERIFSDEYDLSALVGKVTRIVNAVINVTEL